MRSALSLILALALATPLVAGRDDQLELPDGEPLRGRMVFLENHCGMCHQVAGKDLPRPMKQPWTSITLGGPEEPVPSKTRLVNDIVNPQHRIDPAKWPDPQGLRLSPMIDFTVNLTVRDLIDLVAFLRGAYGVRPKGGGAR